MPSSRPRSPVDPPRKKPMPELNIEREHSLGLEGARLVALRWREQAEQDWGMHCASEPGEAVDCMRFERSGVRGELTLSDTRFDLRIKLGFLLGAYSAKIEEKIQANLDALLGPA